MVTMSKNPRIQAREPRLGRTQIKIKDIENVGDGIRAEHFPSLEEEMDNQVREAFRTQQTLTRKLLNNITSKQYNQNVKNIKERTKATREKANPMTRASTAFLSSAARRERRGSE